MRDELTPTESYDDIGPEEGGGIDEDVISSYVMGFHHGKHGHHPHHHHMHGDAAYMEGHKHGRHHRHHMHGEEMGLNRFAKKAVVATVPGAGATFAVADAAKDPKTKKAGKVLAKARSGDPHAKQQIHDVRKGAAAGDPKSKAALARLHAVNKAAKMHDLNPNVLYARGVV